jgi:hypothetical protein
MAQGGQRRHDVGCRGPEPPERQPPARLWPLELARLRRSKSSPEGARNSSATCVGVEPGRIAIARGRQVEVRADAGDDFPGHVRGDRSAISNHRLTGPTSVFAAT